MTNETKSLWPEDLKAAAARAARAAEATKTIAESLQGLTEEEARRAISDVAGALGFRVTQIRGPKEDKPADEKPDAGKPAKEPAASK